MLSDVNTNEMYMIIINISLDICKKHIPPKKRPRKHQIPRDRITMMGKRSKLQKKMPKATNNQYKVNVSNQIDNIFKISLNNETNLRETRAIASIKQNTKYFYKCSSSSSSSSIYNTDGGISVPKQGFVNPLSTTRGLSTPLAGFAYRKIGFAHPKRAL